MKKIRHSNCVFRFIFNEDIPGEIHVIILRFSLGLSYDVEFGTKIMPCGGNDQRNYPTITLFQRPSDVRDVEPRIWHSNDTGWINGNLLHIQKTIDVRMKKSEERHRFKCARQKY